MSTKYLGNRTFQKALTELGLSENESAVYIAALNLGVGTVTQISKLAEIKRTTAYTVLENLKRRGFVSIEAKGKYQRYIASHPETLSAVISSKLDFFQKILPDMVSLYNLKGATGTTRMYQGVEATKNVYELLLKNAKPDEPYYVLSDIKNSVKIMGDFLSGFVERRAKLGIKPLHIFAESDQAKIWSQKLKRLGAESHTLPAQVKFSINMVIIPNMVVIHQLVSPVQAVVIESPAVAEMMQQMFKIIWWTIDSSRRKNL